MNKKKLKELASELDAAPRTAPEGSAEGARVVTLTDEAAKKLSQDLRAAAGAHGQVALRIAADLDAALRMGPEGKGIVTSHEIATRMAEDLRSAADALPQLRYAEQFGAGEDYKATEFKSSTANPKDGTIDCVWYGGQPVVRRDPDTGDPYMLTLDMAGCRMQRLNSGAPVFDTHFSGDDFKSLIAGKVGTNAQVGVVQKAWAEGKKGMATLKFDMDKPEGAEMFRKAASGQVRNLSHGTWIYNREKTSAASPGAQASQEGKPPYSDPNEMGMFTATDWEPFEISPCTVPADFSTQFLSAAGGEDEAQRAQRARREKETKEMTEQELAAARDEAANNAVKAERQRVIDIRLMAGPFKLKDEFISKLIGDGLSVDDARKNIMTELAAAGQRDANGGKFEIRGEFTELAAEQDKKLPLMEAALLLRGNSKFYLAKSEITGKYLAGCGEEQHRKAEEMAREYRGLSLLEMAREALHMRRISTRGLNRMEIARLSLQPQAPQYFGAESTSDFPGILANVANKTLRQAYEAYPRTFQPLARMVTAPDFKPINRAQLSDAPSLQALNERGEYHRANLTDSNQNYALATFGEVVAITRKVIINDDLQAFTRVPAILGVAAARLESDTVWAVITANQVMQADNVALFNAGHSNLFTGANSSLITNALGALNTGRQNLRLQKAPQGTPLNLTPRFLVLPAALETYGLQVVYPVDIASTDVTKVVPEWVRSMVPIVEPRLDANSSTAWYLFADPAQIDTLEYCYLEGQEGVYIETRQGFEVDGVEIKARLDFAAAAIDYRGMQKNAGA